MNTSQITFLSKPVGDEPISEGKLEYIREKLRSDLHELMLSVFLDSGISQATLAKRLKKDKGQVSRTLGSPGNWTFDTVADYFFAIDGKLLKPDAIEAVCLAHRNMKIQDIATELLSLEKQTKTHAPNAVFVNATPLAKRSIAP
ncbi:hypothetical protein [Brucella anthropi]|uniref:hypothetical protein n=1 Tax=Brucella anthropi TaxID=529 RepID=UPI00124D7556|nr:hypothetical protein [Brucella anthropi]KAB2725661.1 hypothetical protein F9K76_12820 [Brucella anthropi]KAB2742972.1 hypothetical protein F9K74_12765 [Brucella anthropi]KAB2803793.1 hypothetical protein F9K83_12765 [Brucella anthropi]